MLKVVTLVGTRPELIKLSRVIAELDLHMKHILVHSGQNYDFELNEVFFRDLGIRRPDYFLEAAGLNAAGTIANVIEKFDAVLAEERPGAMLILGDTNSCLGVIAAKKRRVPIFHMEAGNRCFDERVPEEVNRRIIDHVSDINLVYTEHARRYLMREGLRPDTIIKTGSPMMEVLNHHADSIAASSILNEMKLQEDGFILVSAHREENVDSEPRLSALLASLQVVAEEFSKKIIFSTHPRTRRRCEEFGLKISDCVELSKPFGFFDYIKLQKSAWCVASDSGTLTEEAAILGFPAVMLRDAHERPEGMDEGVAVMSGLKASCIIDSIRLATQQDRSGFRLPEDYASANVSAKVVRLIASYTEFVRRTVWSED